MEEILVSVVMAAYNSSATIEMSLKSIRGQTLPEGSVEILVIDGGSTDDTRNICARYGAAVYDNPQRLPEMAKRIGVRKAKGKYVQIMDSDEVLPSDDVFARRLAFMEKHRDLMVLLSGYDVPDGLPACGHYISKVGDPFSTFVYGWYIDGNVGLIKRKDILHDSEGYIGSYGDDDIMPLGDSLTMIRSSYLFERYDSVIDTENTSTIVTRIMEETRKAGFVRDDYVLHYTRSGFSTYLKKLKFRVINNVFDVNGSGYSARTGGMRKLSFKKYLYPFYCLSLILPVIDGIRMGIYYRKAVYLLHPLFAWYVLCQILIQYSKKLAGKKSRNDSYGY